MVLEDAAAAWKLHPPPFWWLTPRLQEGSLQSHTECAKAGLYPAAILTALSTMALIYVREGLGGSVTCPFSEGLLHRGPTAISVSLLSP